MTHKNVSHHQLVYVKHWGPTKLFDVRTTEGFALEYHFPDPAALAEQRLKEGESIVDALHEPVKGYDAALLMQQKGAIEVEDGEVIEIEGRLYKARTDQGADELRFDPVGDPAT